MTIAICYVSPEGIVLGADSTSSVPTAVGYHYFNFNQKIFEIGEGSRLGLLTWGLGSLGATTSHRTLVALLADDLAKKPAASVEEVARRWIDLFWPKYSEFIQQHTVFTTLKGKAPFDAKAAPPNPAARTEEEEKQYKQLKLNLSVGFCIGGYCVETRDPVGYQIVFDSVAAAAPAPSKLTYGNYNWGVPNMIHRLLKGHDPGLAKAILDTGKWSGTPDELLAVLKKQVLLHDLLPIRDAVDFVYSCIHSTIKAMKFSNLPQTCGGPIEIAVITSDRNFRWVKHKPWDAAITAGD